MLESGGMGSVHKGTTDEEQQKRTNVTVASHDV